MDGQIVVETSFQKSGQSVRLLGRDSEPNLTSTLTQNVKIRDLSIVCGKTNNFWLNWSQSTKLWLNKQFVVKPVRKMMELAFITAVINSFKSIVV